MKLEPITIRYLSGHDVAAVALSNDEILSAIEGSLRARGNGDTVIEPRMHLRPSQSVDGHFNVLRQRRKTPGDGVAALIAYFNDLIPALERNRSPAPDIETLLDHFDNPEFIKLTH